MNFAEHIKKIVQHKVFQWWGVCFGISLLLYWRTVLFGFFSDDFHLLHVFSKNSNILSYFLTNIIGERGGGSYGPVYNALFIFLHSIFGMHTWGYHLFMILVHSVNGMLVYLFARQLFHDKYIALFSSLCFLLFQSHTSSITWVSTIPHVVTTMCILVTIVSYTFFITGKKRMWYASAVILYFLALFSKEIAITTPIFLVILDIVFSPRETYWQTVRRLVKRMFPFVLLTLVYLFLRRYTTHIVAGYYGSSGFQFDVLLLVKHFFETIVHTVVPASLRLPIMYRIGFHIGIVFFIAAIVFGIKIKLSRHKKEYIALVSLYLIASLPFLQVMFHPVNDANERYTYLLSAFLSIIIVYSLFLLLEKFRYGRHIAISILILFFCTQIVFGQIKQRSWIVADKAVSGIIASTGHIDARNAYIVFIGLPDNIDGAEVFRNAIKEGIDLSTDRGYVAGERIPIYVAPSSETALGDLVTVNKLSPMSFRFTATDKQVPRIFTGFPVFSSDIGTFTMEQPKFPEHSGVAIHVDLYMEAVERLQSEGKKVLIAYYNQGGLQIIPIE